MAEEVPVFNGVGHDKGLLFIFVPAVYAYGKGDPGIVHEQAHLYERGRLVLFADRRGRRRRRLNFSALRIFAFEFLASQICQKEIIEAKGDY